VMIHPYSVITYQPEEWRDPFYLVQPDYAAEKADNLIAALGSAGAAGVAFRDIGSLLSADYNPRRTVTREQVLSMNTQTLETAKAVGQRVSVLEGFDFVLPYADLICGMTLKGSSYSIIDEFVPFYQIALHGAVSYTGKAINLASDWRTELLRCAEYGAGLNFTFMAEDAKLLQDTYHSGYFGAHFDSWTEAFDAIVTEYQTSMAGLNSTPIIGHDILSDGVTRTLYQNGAAVYVNYTEKPFDADGVTIPERSYIVTGGEGK